MLDPATIQPQAAWPEPEYRPEDMYRHPIAMGVPMTDKPAMLRMARENVYQALAQKLMVGPRPY